MVAWMLTYEVVVPSEVMPSLPKLFLIALISAAMLFAVDLFAQDKDSLKRREQLRQDIVTMAERMRRERIISSSVRDSLVLLVGERNDGVSLGVEQLSSLRDNLEQSYSEQQSGLAREYFGSWESVKGNLLPKILSIPGGDHRSENTRPMETGHGRSPGDDESVRFNSIERMPARVDTLSRRDRKLLRILSRFTGGSVSVDNPFGGVYNPTQLHIPEPPGRPRGLDERMFEDTLRFDPKVYKLSSPFPFRVTDSDRKAFSEAQKKKKESESENNGEGKADKETQQKKD